MSFDEEPDWDYSVPVDIPDSSPLQDLRDFEGALYNSILEEESRYTREALQAPKEASLCTNCMPSNDDADELPPTLFFQTYYRNTDGSLKKRIFQPEPAPPVLAVASSSSSSSFSNDDNLTTMSDCNENDDRQEEALDFAETTPSCSPFSSRKATPKASNTTSTKQLRLSTIPPPSCSPPSFTHLLDTATTSRTSPTSIDEIFQDLAQLEELQHKSSFSVTTAESTTLGSMDTTTVAHEDDDFDSQTEQLYEESLDEQDYDEFSTMQSNVVYTAKQQEHLVSCLKNKTVSIHNGGRKVLSWSKDPPLIIDNDGRTVMRMTVQRDDATEDCWQSSLHCPSAAAADY